MFRSWYEQQQQPQAMTSVVYIQGGEQAIGNYLVAPNQSVILIDNETGMIAIKSADVSGRLMPTRIFVERKPVVPQQPQNDFITRDEFEKRIKELINDKQSVPAE